MLLGRSSFLFIAQAINVKDIWQARLHAPYEYLHVLLHQSSFFVSFNNPILTVHWMFQSP